LQEEWNTYFLDLNTDSNNIYWHAPGSTNEIIMTTCTITDSRPCIAPIRCVMVASRFVKIDMGFRWIFSYQGLVLISTLLISFNSRTQNLGKHQQLRSSSCKIIVYLLPSIFTSPKRRRDCQRSNVMSKASWRWSCISDRYISGCRSINPSMY